MTNCANCGTGDQNGRFCVHCGSALPESPAGPVSLQKTPPTGVPGRTIPGAAPVISVPQPPFQPEHAPGAVPGRTPARSGRGAGPFVLVALVVAALLVAGVGAWVLFRPDAAQGAGVSATMVAPPTAVSSPNQTGATSSVAKGAPRPAPAAGGNGAAGAAAQGSTRTSPSVSADPMGGPRADIACNTGYIVQVASELDRPTFEARVATLRTDGTLPADAKWTETSTSCGIFTNQRNAFVLYVGPFPDPTDGCPARLASPADAFLKDTNPNDGNRFFTCMCPAFASAPPSISAVGQQGAWVGELQRVLGAGLDYNVGNINADPQTGDPGRWGIYTAETAAAVGRFQANQGVPVTERVDAATWSLLQNAVCGRQ